VLIFRLWNVPGVFYPLLLSTFPHGKGESSRGTGAKPPVPAGAGRNPVFPFPTAKIPIFMQSSNNSNRYFNPICAPATASPYHAKMPAQNYSRILTSHARTRVLYHSTHYTSRTGPPRYTPSGMLYATRSDDGSRKKAGNSSRKLRKLRPAGAR
jgi:hypothetical protein